MQNTAYRLAQYKIIENEHGDFWWENHTGLGSLRSGKCFINGGILFIAPSNITGPGFLKGEFLDHLNKLPKWEKTKYYCSSCTIYECKSGNCARLFEAIDSRLKNGAILRKNGSTKSAMAEADLKWSMSDGTAHISYKLYRYEIAEMNNGQLIWKFSSGLGRLKRGRCCIKGEILFLEPGETEQSCLKRKEFLYQLNKLPDWVRTKYFCTDFAIYYSSTGAVCRRLGEEKDLSRTETQNVVVNRKAYSFPTKIGPILANKSAERDKLIAYLRICKLLVILFMKLLFGGSQIVYTIIRSFFNKCKGIMG